MSSNTRLLQNPSFRLFWLSRLLSITAYQMLAVAVGWQVYDLTHSALDLGYVGLAQFLPALLLVMVVGHVADRYDRRRIVMICQGIQALAAVGLALASAQGWVSEYLIFAVVVLIGTARAFESPTLQALAPGLVVSELIPRAAAASAIAMQIGIVAGPALGGLIYILGPGAVYGAGGACLLLASLLAALIHPTRTTTPSREPVSLESIFAGIVFLRAQPALLGAISLDLFAVLLGGATALLPIYARDILVVGSWGLGLLRTAPAVGALLTAALLARHPLQRRVGAIMLVAVAVFGAATMLFAVSRSFSVSLLLLVVLGASDMISVVIRSALVQIRTPDAMRGRVSAVNSVFIGTSNQLGEFESGVTAMWFGVIPAVLIGGVGTLLVVVAWLRLFPELARIDRLADDALPRKT
ncbi:MAG: MFS transporter [Candidatus Competibacteraceae bacterium]